MPPQSWAEEAKTYKEAGFSDDEIGQEEQSARQKMSLAGFSGKEIGEYFGTPYPDITPTKEYIKANLSKFHAEQTAPPVASITPISSDVAKASPPEKESKPGAEKKTEPKKVATFTDAVEAGFQMSITGLMARQKNPDVILPEDAPMFYNIAANATTLAGDIPAMVSGGVAGGLIGAGVGSAAPVVGTAAGLVVGTGAGSMAMPAALRRMMMDHYEKGDIKTFSDFWERAAGTFLDASKGAIVGGATAGSGGAIAKVVGPVAAPAIAKTGAVAASEIATMVTVGKALEGQTPNLKDFTEAAIMVGGLHVAAAGAKPVITRVSSKLKDVYAKTGVAPSQVSEQIRTDAVTHTDMLAENMPIPEAYKKLEEPIPGEQKPTLTEVPAKFTKENAALGEGFTPRPEKITIAEEKVLSQVGDKQKPEKALPTWNDFYAGYVDRFDPINNAVKALVKDPKSLPTMENPYELARMANDYKSKARHMFEKGTLDYETMKTVGPSLNEIMKPVGKDIEPFKAYLVAARAIELSGRKIESGIDLAAAKEVVKNSDAKFSKAASALVEYQNSVLQYLKDSGYITDKSLAAMKEANKNYVPFARLTEEGVNATGKSSVTPIKAIKGSELKIANPLESIVENTAFFIKLAEENRARDALAKLADKAPDNGLVKKISAETKAVEIEAENAGRMLTEHVAGKDKENNFSVYRGGKREVYSTTPEIAEALKALDGEPAATGFLFSIAKNIAAITRLSVSSTPDFLFRNFFRDQLTAGTFSKYKTIPFVDAIFAMKDIIGKSDVYYEWLKSGGASGSFMEMDKRYIENKVFSLSKQIGLIDKTWNVIRTPIDMLRVAGELAEQSTRLAEFKKTTKGSTAIGDLFKGGMAAREVTVDFTRIGANMKALNAITAFQNVSIQGLDRTIRAFKEDPAGLTTKAVASITVPSVMLWYANHDDPRYKEIPRWQKDLFWIVMTDKNIYRIPKPQELGLLFGSLPERTLEAFFTDNPKAFAEFKGTVGEALVPSIVPNIASPVIEHYFNRSLFTGSKIIPDSVEKVLPEYQYNPYTSETGKMLGKMIAAIPGMKENSMASPLVVENYIRAWSGNLGGYFLQLADKALTASGAVTPPVKPAKTLADIPVVKAFVVRYPSATSQSIQDFYDRYESQQKRVATIQMLAKSGRYEDVQHEMEDQNNQVAFAKLSGIKDALGNQNRAIQLIYNNKDVTADEKRQMIDGLYFQMIEETKMGNAMMDSLEKSLKKK